MGLIEKLSNIFKKKKQKKVCNCKFCQQQEKPMLGKYQKPTEQKEENETSTDAKEMYETDYYNDIIG